jgi:hypothetical protein
LSKYANEELDQWSRWRMESEFGEVYINISRAPDPQYPVTAYGLVSPDMPLRDDPEAT